MLVSFIALLDPRWILRHTSTLLIIDRGGFCFAKLAQAKAAHCCAEQD
jgi:hypothetical protein